MKCIMEDKDLITLTETAARSKSNSHQIVELKDEIKEIRNEQKAIYTIATSVELIAKDMSSMKDSLNEVKQGQKELSSKVDEQIKEVKQEVKSIDNKSKVDLLKYVTSNWYKLAFGAGGIGAVIYYIQELTK